MGELKLKDDMRVIRTKRAIREAFLKLLAKKVYEKITVQDIADEAFINRNTFYFHYIDKADLLEKLSSECLDEIKKCLVEKESSEINDEFLYDVIKNIFNTIEKNKDFYRIMMVDSDSAFFTERLTATIKAHIHPYVVSPGLEEKELLIEYLITGFIGIMRIYLKGDIKISKERLSDFLFKFLHENPYAFLLKNA